MYYTHISSLPVVWIIMIICQKRRFSLVCFELGKTSLCQVSVFVGIDIHFQQHFNWMCPYFRPLLVQTVIFLVLCNSINPFKRPRLCINERWEAGRGPVFNNIPDIRAAVWIKCTPLPYCLFLLGSMRLHCFPHDIIFCPGLCLLATVHANQKLWFMHLSCSGLDIKFNFAAVEGRLPWAQPRHGEPGPAAAPVRIHYFLHNMRKQHLNETFVSCQNRVASTLPTQIHGNGEERNRRQRLAVTKQQVS